MSLNDTIGDSFCMLLRVLFIGTYSTSLHKVNQSFWSCNNELRELEVQLKESEVPLKRYFD